MLAGLGPKPAMLYHLHKEGAGYAVRCNIPVTQDYKPLATPAPYNKLDTEATKAIASLVSEANGNDPDLTKHPWALRSVWGLAAPQGIAVLLEWQPAAAMPRFVTADDATSVTSGSMTPRTVVAGYGSSVASGSGTVRWKGVDEADETGSFMYVIPYAHYTRG